MFGFLFLSGSVFAVGKILDQDAETLRITEQSSPGMWQGYEFGRPLKFYEYIEDFSYYVSADWTVTESDSAAVQALATAAPTVGGVLLLTNTGTDDDAISLQKLGQSFVPTAATNIWCEALFQSTEATQEDWLFGLVVTDTTPLSNTDGVYFRKDDGDTQVDFETNSSSTASTETNIFTYASTTYLRVGFKITGTSSVDYYVNGVSQGTLTTNIPTSPLRVTIHFQDGDTAGAVAAQQMSVDYFACVQSRPQGGF